MDMVLAIDKKIQEKVTKAAVSDLGIVVQKEFTFGSPGEGILLESKKEFGPVTVRYETYGELNKDKSNAILIVHAFSGDAHAAGVYSDHDKYPGWWDTMIGPGKAFDTNKYFIISSNILGGCQGTTGPGSINPETGTPYGLDFPLITINDMVNVQHKLVRHLGIEKLVAVAGGSMGGMQALEWAITYPDMVESAIVIASTTKLTAQSIAFNAVGRNAIMSDPNWMDGNYYGEAVPRRGLAIARMIGHITYLSDESMRMKFGRRLQEKEAFAFDFTDQFEVESYLEYQGAKFVERFDANSYIYISRAMDYFDLAQEYGELTNAFEKVKSKFLIISYSSDWLFPSYQSKEMVFALMKCHKDVSYTEIESPYGHDAFLLETERQKKIIASFLGTVYNEK